MTTRVKSTNPCCAGNLAPFTQSPSSVYRNGAVRLQEEYREILAREEAAAWRTEGFKQFAISWLLSSLCAIPPEPVDLSSSVWTRPWTVKQEFTKQNDQENRIYYEPRCVEGNYALPGWLRGHRLEELAFTEGRGPDPATKDGSEALTQAEVPQDPLQ
jgi:hypothetical protein